MLDVSRLITCEFDVDGLGTARYMYLHPAYQPLRPTTIVSRNGVFVFSISHGEGDGDVLEAIDSHSKGLVGGRNARHASASSKCWRSYVECRFLVDT